MLVNLNSVRGLELPPLQDPSSDPRFVRVLFIPSLSSIRHYPGRSAGCESLFPVDIMSISKEAAIDASQIEKVQSHAYVHHVHKIEGTNILVHEETEEEANARKYGDADKVTAKTWVVVTVLALSYAVSFWPVPNLSYFEGVLAPALGNAANATWFIEVIEMVNSVSFLICGANSDLFGRRW